MSKFPTTVIFLDKYHPKADGTCSVSIRVTYNRKNKYYPTKYKLTLKEFDDLARPKLTGAQKMINAVLSDHENRAVQIIDDLKDRLLGPYLKKDLQEKLVRMRMCLHF